MTRNKIRRFSQLLVCFFCVFGWQSGTVMVRAQTSGSTASPEGTAPVSGSESGKKSGADKPAPKVPGEQPSPGDVASKQESGASSQKNNGSESASPTGKSSESEAPGSSANKLDDNRNFPVTGDELEGVPLTVGGIEILRFKGTISGFTPEQRVRAILFRIHELELASKLDIDNISTRETGFSTDVVSGPETIFTITSRDAKLVGSEAREDLALECVQKLKAGLKKEQSERSPKVLFMATVFTGIAFVVLLLALGLLSALFPWLYSQILSARGKYIASIRIQKAELISEQSLTEILVGLCRLIRALLTLLLFVTFAELALSFYPSTRAISGQVTQKFIYPMIAVIMTSVTAYVPNLLIIAAVGIGTYYLLAFTRFIFNEVGRGSITLSGFEPEWAEPTYSIIRFLIVSFALVLSFPYLPGSGSPAFQQVSIFLGVLISLGSSGAVSNLVAGVFLTYTGAFRLGDRVRIADTVGDVTERRLLYTRVRTIKDEFITIPNSLVLGAHIINYSASRAGNGLVLHTSVTIGYDVDWRTVENLLIEAAKQTEHVREEPPPFVFITSLDDFFVTHQINAYTSTPHAMAQIYAELHKNILDKFNQAGVEIMSPHYYSVRDGSGDAIPAQHRGKEPPRRSVFPSKTQ